MTEVALGNNSETIIKKEKLGILLLGVLFIVPFLILAGVIWKNVSVSADVGPVKTVSIEPGTGFFNISQELQDQGVIKSAAAFRLYVLMRGWAESLQGGQYSFQGNVNIPQVALRLEQGPGDITVTIPEGWTVAQIDSKLASLHLAKPGEIIALSQSPQTFSSSYIFLQSPDITTLEGFLFPDTYRFRPKTDTKTIIETFLNNFGKKALPVMQQSFAENNSSDNKEPFTVISVASMIEDEAKTTSDRQVISGILWKRLAADVPLQVDSTVIYAWRQVNPSWKPAGASLGPSALRINSPYNTYRFRGLPPGPIGNPGLDSIMVALHPQDSDFWYYISTPDGKIIFSKTLAEQNLAVAEYLK